MTSDTVQQTLDGRLIPIQPRKRECHVWILEDTYHLTDQVKLIGGVFKSDLAEAGIQTVVAIAAELGIPVKQLITKLRGRDQKEIFETLSNLFSL